VFLFKEINIKIYPFLVNVHQYNSIVKILLDNIPKEILKLFASAKMNNFQIDRAFKNNKNDV
jgi:hypothetical protein